MASFSLLRSLKTHFQQASARRIPRGQPRRKSRGGKLQLESLEVRNLLSAYIVNTTVDSGVGSLRDAINQINLDTSHALYASPSNPNVDEIDFNIPTTDAGL